MHDSKTDASSVHSVVLLDDNKATNFIHKRFMEKSGLVKNISTFEIGHDAIEYLRTTDVLPKLIFVDINMPAMDGWEFLDEYHKLDLPDKEGTLVFMLTTSVSVQDAPKVSQYKDKVAEILLKPLDTNAIQRVFKEYGPAVGS